MREKNLYQDFKPSNSLITLDTKKKIVLPLEVKFLSDRYGQRERVFNFRIESIMQNKKQNKENLSRYIFAWYYHEKNERRRRRRDTSLFV